MTDIWKKAFIKNHCDLIDDLGKDDLLSFLAYLYNKQPNLNMRASLKGFRKLNNFPVDSDYY
jgi:hypothetical protein